MDRRPWALGWTSESGSMGGRLGGPSKAGALLSMPEKVHMPTSPDPRLPTICPTCGAPFTRDDQAAQCHDCQPVNRCQTTTSCRTRDRITRGNSNEQGYDQRWRVLSERARRAQPFCTDCRSPFDLTCDHSPEAWRRRERGQVIRLRDVDVVCRRCNSERGSARGADMRARPSPVLPCPVCLAPTHATAVGTVSLHDDGARRTCTMSGQPWTVHA